jgi:HemY protein
MRLALWITLLFAAAVGVALFATRSTGTVTLFWPPYRIDLSLNLVVLLLAALFALLYLAIRAAAALAELPTQARQWRAAQREQAMHEQLHDALAHWMAGRFARAKKLALSAAEHASKLLLDSPSSSSLLQVRALALQLAAEGAHSLQDASAREALLEQALAVPLPKSAGHLREGIALRSASWRLKEHDADTALTRLAVLPAGAQRRTLALRLKLRALRLAKKESQALETARLLAKHGGFPEHAASSMLRSLSMATLGQAHDASQISRAWKDLTPSERLDSEVANYAAQRLLNLGAGSPDSAEIQEQALSWIEPIWRRYPELDSREQTRVINSLLGCIAAGTVNAAWLAQIEAAQRQLPRDAQLQFLAGQAFLSLKLWGKAQQMFEASAAQLQEPTFKRQAWCSLATLAEQRGDTAAASAAWKRAALLV